MEPYALIATGLVMLLFGRQLGYLFVVEDHGFIFSKRAAELGYWLILVPIGLFITAFGVWWVLEGKPGAS